MLHGLPRRGQPRDADETQQQRHEGGGARADAAGPGPFDEDEEQWTDADGERGVGLKQRVWPMVEMLKRAKAANEPIVWGV